MGFERNRQRPAPDRAGITAAVLRLITAEEIAAVAAEANDPFQVAHNCINKAGHYPIRSAGDIVCAHCEKVFWR